MPSKSNLDGARRFKRNTPESVVIRAFGDRAEPAKKGRIDSTSPMENCERTADISCGDKPPPRTTGSVAGWSAPLLKILDLFLHAVHSTLDLNNVPSDIAVETLAANRVGFAKHFLAQKVECATNEFALVGK